MPNLNEIAGHVISNGSNTDASYLDLSPRLDATDWESGYKVQDILHQHLHHGNIVGRKIAFNSAELQTKMGISKSGFGRCYKVLPNTLSRKDFVQLAVEPEIFAKILTDNTVIAQAHSVAPSYNYTLAVGWEILDLRNSFHLSRHIPSLLAQNIFCAGFIPGDVTDKNESSNIETTGIFKRNNVVVPTSGAPQDPHTAVRDIISHFHARGDIIRKDEWLALGSHCSPVVVTESCEFSFEIEGLGAVQLSIS